MKSIFLSTFICYIYCRCERARLSAGLAQELALRFAHPLLREATPAAWVAKACATPKDWPSPTQMSQPHEAGAASMAEAYGKATFTAENRKPIESAISRIRWRAANIGRIRAETAAWLKTRG